MEKEKLDLKSIKNKCLRLLTKRDHTSFELKKKLSRYYVFADVDFAEALAWLDEVKVLPDENLFAQRLADKYRREGRGRRWIAGKLAAKGVKLESLKDDDSEMSSARVFLEKKLRGQAAQSLDFQEKQRLARQMTTRGFSFDVVRQLLNEIKRSP